jgi:hypothetical protein
MLLTRAFLDPFLVYAAAFGLMASILTVFVVRDPYRVRMEEHDEVKHLATVTLLCTMVAWIGGGNAGAALLAAAISTIAGAGLRLILPRLTLVGAMAMVTMPLGFLASVPWAWLLLVESGADGWLLAMSAVASAAGLIGIAIAFVESLARGALLTHAVWRQPYRPLACGTGRQPRVCIQLPCYAEPPEVVIATLDRLARLDYPDFEVMVCDNNTPDEALWRPLEAHCHRLNARLGQDRFRFFHVASLPGAKAGALNYCLDRMDPDAETRRGDRRRLSFAARFPYAHRRILRRSGNRLCSDAARLSRLGGERVSDRMLLGIYAQQQGRAVGPQRIWRCIHDRDDVRDQTRRAGGGGPLGGMVPDRRFRGVGPAARIGQRGIYLRETFGRGLIPESFSDYKKQRLRWTAGPVQQLRRHWRLYLPGPWFVPSALDPWSRFLEVQRGIAPVFHALGMAMGLAGLALFAILAANGVLPVLSLPPAAWIVLAIGTVNALIARWHRYRLSGCMHVADMLRGELARLSLGYIQMVAGIAGLSSKPLAWRRTPKFGTNRVGLRALADTLPETAIGLGHFAMMAIPVTLSAEIGWHMAGLLLAGFFLSGISFLAAPVMALLGERALSRQSAEPSAALPATAIPATASAE